MLLAKFKAVAPILIAATLLTGGGSVITYAAWQGRSEAQPDGESRSNVPGNPVDGIPPTRTAPVKQVRSDVFGDPLPPDAIARMGTVRFRTGSPVFQVAFSKDGKSLATAGSDGSIQLWDTATGREMRRVGERRGWWRAAAFSPDGKEIVAAGGSGLHVWETATGKPLPQLELHGHFMYVAFSPDGKILGYTNQDNSIGLVDVATNREIAKLPGHNMFVFSFFAFSPDSRFLAYRNPNDVHISLYDIHAGKESRRLIGHTGAIQAIAYSPDGKMLASSSIYDNSLRIWDPATGKELRKAKPNGGYALAFSPDSATLAVSGSTVTLWDVAAGRKIGSMDRYSPGNVEFLTFSPDGKRLAATCDGVHAVYVWDVTTGKPLVPGRGHVNGIRSLDFSGDGRTLAAAAGEWGEILRWESATGKALPSVKTHYEGTYGVSYSPDGKILAAATGNHNGTVWLSDADTGKKICSFVVPGAHVLSIAFSEDGKKLVSKTGNHAIHFWDVAKRAELRKLNGLPHGPIALSPDGRLYADADSLSGTVVLGETSTGKQLFQFGGNKHGTFAVAFSPDGGTLATVGLDDARGALDNPVRFWDMTTGRQIGQSDGHGDVPTFVAFSRDGKMLASGTQDGIVRLWESATGKLRLKFVGHRAGITAGAFSQDDRFLATGSHDTSILVWDVTGQHSAGDSRRKRQPTELDAHWQDLASTDAAKAFHAIQALVGSPTQSPLFLKQNLRPAVGVPASTLENLIADLDNARFEAREKAEKAIDALGDAVQAELRKAAKDHRSAEVLRRLERLLENLDNRPIRPKRLRILRAIEVLEYIGTPEARQILETLGKGAPQARVTREAKYSLGRLAKRPAPHR